MFEPATRKISLAPLLLIRSDETVWSAGLAAYEEFWSNPQTEDRHATELLNVYEQILSRG